MNQYLQAKNVPFLMIFIWHIFVTLFTKRINNNFNQTKLQQMGKQNQFSNENNYYYCL